MVAIADDIGGIVEEQRYLPFGGVREDAGAITQTDWGYTGQRNIPEMGLMDYRARLYSATAMRFIQPDTIVPAGGDPQAWNRYSYAIGNPVQYADPSGHCALLAEDAEGLCVIVTEKEEKKTTQIVHGGHEFVNRVEVGLANYMMSGDTRWLNAIPDGTRVLALQYSIVAVAANLGYDTGYGDMDPTVVLLAMVMDPNGLNSDDDGLAFVADPAVRASIRDTLSNLDQGGPLPFSKDGQVFNNAQGRLPTMPTGYYREYTVITPGASARGPVRIVAGQNGEAYLTLDHYRTFTRIR